MNRDLSCTLGSRGPDNLGLGGLDNLGLPFVSMALPLIVPENLGLPLVSILSGNCMTLPFRGPDKVCLLTGNAFLSSDGPDALTALPSVSSSASFLISTGPAFFLDNASFHVPRQEVGINGSDGRTESL